MEERFVLYATCLNQCNPGILLSVRCLLNKLLLMMPEFRKVSLCSYFTSEILLSGTITVTNCII